MTSLKDAFISYGRADSKAFAQKLCDRLTQAGFDIWFDFEDIPFGVDYQDEIDAGIGNADNFLFLISPHSVNSAYCAKEVKLALAYNKRIIPLMHVEEISYDTWQQRHPQGTEAEWQDYQAKGLHASYPNLHPAIGRINWIFFREGIDDFDVSCANLLALLQQHNGYVRQHTQYLAQALEWDRNQRQGTFLLADADIYPAKNWLRTRFTETLPPCLPTTLHSEFITESLKQSDRGMTDVFLSYSEDDRAIQQQVRLALARQGFTVWTNTTDIRTGVDFQEAIQSGIEKADTIVFLLSPYSLASTYCQDELTYGQTYNKRVIPILIAPMDVESLPEMFQSVQFIDGMWSETTESENLEDATGPQENGTVKVSDQAIAQLIRSLNDNADYYTQHKRLLVKALEWDRRDRPNDAVLRGQEFVAAEAWLELSKHLITNPSTNLSTNPSPRPYSLPLTSPSTAALTGSTRLHQAFIAASAAQNRFFDAFISYGRADSLAFATRLYDQLVDAGLNVWFDKEDIPFGVDFQTQIDDGIERAHNFLFIIAPHSVHSPYCLKEIELALRCNKRIIPLMHVEEVSYETWRKRFPNKPMSAWEEHKAQGKHSSFTALHPEIGKINWISFIEEVDDFDQSLAKLTQLIHQHEQYVRQHTTLLVHSLEWERRQRSQRNLLVGKERQSAEDWLHQQFIDEQAPCIPTDLQCQFITESSKLANHSMTQVFLCFAEEDTDFKEQLRQTLRRQEAQQAPQELSQELNRPLSSHATIYKALIRAGITVWTYATDIRTGEQTEEAVNRGIEGADTFIFLLTSHSIQSNHCLRELNYAISLNKQVIPVMVAAIIKDSLPTPLQALQLIDLTHDGPPDPLLNALRQDQSYHRIHKQLLVTALKWERQEHNPTQLLRGKTLKQYQSWLQLAKKRSQSPPIALQKTFLEESSQQPPLLTVDVFIIYTPSDYEFVQRLNDTLQIQNKRTWFDETIGDGSIQDVEAINADQLENGIDQSENIIFVVSPDSIKDARCIQELNYAHQHSKRIIPVLYSEVLSAKQPPILKDIPWLDFQSSGDFLNQFGTLYRKLESDPSHIRPHTLLMVRSQEWQDAERDDSYLLRGKELRSAQEWLAQAATKTPPPNDLQQEYIDASQALPFRKLKKRSIVLTSIASTIVVFGMRLVGLLQPMELSAYDAVLNLKPDEPQDDRFLIVKMDDESGEWLRAKMVDGTYVPSIGTIPEEALAQAINNLNALGPNLISLDFYRDYPASKEMVDVFTTTENLMGICKTKNSTDEDATGYAAPAIAEIPTERVGFNNIVIDQQDNILRRYLIKDAANSESCPSQDSFSLLLAQKYLSEKGIGYVSPWDKDGEYEQDMQFDEVFIHQLYFLSAAAYSVFDSTGGLLGGYQTPAHFRTHEGKADQFAHNISLKDVIEGNILAKDVRDRIVIIGYFDQSDRNTDFFNTPYGELTGATIHGQLASQLISAVLDGRSLIWWWPLPVEGLWILGWSLASGFIVWGIVHPKRLGVALLTATIALCGSCTITMRVSSGWIPFVPPLLASSITTLITAGRNRQLRRP